jgi:hypothetical protein
MTLALLLVAASNLPHRSGEAPTPSLAGNAPEPEAFVWLSFVDAAASGTPARSLSFHASASGALQIASTRGAVLERLSLRTDVAPRLFDTLPALRADAPAPPRDRSADEVGEYVPALVVTAWASADGGYAMESRSSDALPAGARRLAGLARHVASEHLDGKDEPPAEPGLYARLQRLPRFDPAIQPPDAVLDARAARQEAGLSRLIEHELALVRIADSTASSAPDVTIGSAALRPGRPIHVQVDARFYRIIAYGTDF